MISSHKNLYTNLPEWMWSHPLVILGEKQSIYYVTICVKETKKKKKRAQNFSESVTDWYRERKETCISLYTFLLFCNY